MVKEMKNKVINEAVNEGIESVTKKVMLFDKLPKKSKVVLKIAGLCLGIAAIAFVIKYNYIGDLTYAETVFVENIQVDGKKLQMNTVGAPLVRTKIEENNGEVRLKIYESYRAIAPDYGLEISKTFDNEIEKVVIEGAEGKKVTVYEDGTAIGWGISAIIDAKIDNIHNSGNRADLESCVKDVLAESYIIDIAESEIYMPSDNYAVCYTLEDVDLEEVNERLGNFESEDITLDKYEKAMKKYSVLMVACVGDLSEVSWNVKIDKKEMNYTFTIEDLTEYVGKDIKQCAKSATSLQELMDVLEAK